MPMNSAGDTARVAPGGGLPHSEIPGSTIARISPGLFAACHVLHRLSVPRHPPDALLSRLSATPNGKDHNEARPCASKAVGRIAPPRKRGPMPVRQTLLSEDTSFAGCPMPDPAATPPGPRTVSRLRSHNSLLHICPSANALAAPPRGMPATACLDCFPPRPLAAPDAIAFRRLLRKRLPARPARRLTVKPRGLTGSGGDRARTDDPLLAKQVLSQLSYTPGVCPAFAKKHRPDRRNRRFRRKGPALPGSGFRRLARQTPVASAWLRQAGGGPGRI